MAEEIDDGTEGDALPAAREELTPARSGRPGKAWGIRPARKKPCLAAQNRAVRGFGKTGVEVRGCLAGWRRQIRRGRRRGCVTCGNRP